MPRSQHHEPRDEPSQQGSLLEKLHQVQSSPSRLTSSAQSAQTFPNFGAKVPNLQQLNGLLSLSSCMTSPSPLPSPMANPSAGMDAGVPGFGLGNSQIADGWNLAGQNHCQLVLQAGDVPLVLKMCSAAGVQVLQVNMPGPARPSTATSLFALQAHHHQLQQNAQQIQMKNENSSPGVRPLASCSSWTPTLSAKDLLSSMLPPPVSGSLMLQDNKSNNHMPGGQCFPFGSGPVVGGGILSGDRSSLSLHLPSSIHLNPSLHRSSMETTVIKQVSGIPAVH